MNHLNREQARQLLQLGADPATADMVYVRGSYWNVTGSCATPLENFSDPKAALDEPMNLPTWSVGAMLNLIPCKCHHELTHYGTDGGYKVFQSSVVVDGKAENKIGRTSTEALFSTLIFLFCKGVIAKKGGAQ